MFKKLSVLMIVLSSFMLTACDPAESYRECRSGPDAQPYFDCAFYVLGAPFHPDSWRD